MPERKLSTILALVGVGLLWAACLVILFAPMGSRTTVTGTSAGSQVEVTERTPLWETDHDAAVFIVGVVVAFSVVAVGLIRFGGIVGGLLVALFCGLGLLASMLSVGIFLAPGGACLIAASALSIADRLERRARRRRERRLPAPPHPVAPT